MARPRKEGMDYFPHDVHMSTDKKVKALRIMYGNDGYTFFNIALEMIYQEPNFELDVSDAETIQILASNVEVTVQKLSEMIATAVKHGCFDKERYNNNGVLTSNGILKRADVVTKKRMAMRDNYDNKVSDAETPPEMPPEMPQSKVKESKSKRKVKVNKDKNIGVFESYTSNQELIDTLHSFLEFRKEIKSPLTDHAIKLLLGNMDKLSNSEVEKVEILNQSIVNGWKGVFALNKQQTVLPFKTKLEQEMSYLKGGQPNAKYGTGHGGRTNAELDALSF